MWWSSALLLQRPDFNPSVGAWFLKKQPILTTLIKDWCFSQNISLLIYSEESYGEDNGNPLQYSCLANPMDGGAWWATVHGVARSRTRLSNFTFTFMHWRRKWQPTPVLLPEESQGRASLVGCHLGSHRVGHNWSNLAVVAAAAASYVNRQILIRLLGEHREE